ncbi:hypothetical protein PBY51_017697 [Eleginops maclovinus]|uniref:Uncharacterized protein n=1 Tax=Eleginops maclovinus TaxID=56733 RepID=A0AAN7XM80_ELEMC|nr:hypothetical protein PBY51_017697 [Eleginops maclovinus]
MQEVQMEVEKVKETQPRLLSALPWPKPNLPLPFLTSTRCASTVPASPSHLSDSISSRGHRPVQARNLTMTSARAAARTSPPETYL